MEALNNPPFPSLPHGQHGNPAHAAMDARADHDFHVLIERGEEAHQLLDRKPVEAIIGKRRNFRLWDAEELRRLNLPQASGFDDLINRHSKAGLGLTFGRVGKPDIGKDVGRAACNVVAHFRPPFPCGVEGWLFASKSARARFKRSRTSSTSDCAVRIPDGDFF